LGLDFRSVLELTIHHEFMGFSVMDRPVVPLAVVIDRKGMIARKQPEGDPISG